MNNKIFNYYNDLFNKYINKKYDDIYYPYNRDLIRRKIFKTKQKEGSEDPLFNFIRFINYNNLKLIYFSISNYDLGFDLDNKNEYYYSYNTFFTVINLTSKLYLSNNIISDTMKNEEKLLDIKIVDFEKRDD